MKRQHRSYEGTRTNSWFFRRGCDPDCGGAPSRSSLSGIPRTRRCATGVSSGRALDLHDDDPVSRELSAARERALRAALAGLAHERSPVAELVRQELRARLGYERSNVDGGDATRSEHSELLRAALRAARQSVLAMRSNGEIGDGAFHRMEEELDWLEMAGGSTEE